MVYLSGRAERIRGGDPVTEKRLTWGEITEKYPDHMESKTVREERRWKIFDFRDWIKAYLFIPFDEGDYQDMAKVIGERFAGWRKQCPDFDKDAPEPSDAALAIMKYLDCACTFFPPMADEAPVMRAYRYERHKGAGDGFVPVLVRPDETLLEILVMNADPESGADCFGFDLKNVAEYRKRMLAAPVRDGKAVLEELSGQYKTEDGDDETDRWDEGAGEMEGGYENCCFSGLRDFGSRMTGSLILARIPVKNPWEIFAFLPFGNWNECPDTPELMAAAKYWFEHYGAVPAVMTNDELEFELLSPVPEEKAMEAAAEQYGFCPYLDQNGDGTIGSLADVLRQSTVWYFWWD